MKLLFALLTLSLPAQAAELTLRESLTTKQLSAWSYVGGIECRELADVPAAYVCLTDSNVNLRALLGRASYFTEGKPARTLTSESDETYLDSAQANYEGHDVMAVDLELFYERSAKACPLRAEYCVNPLKARLRDVVIQRAREAGHKNYVVVAAAAAAPNLSEILSHEILHARFFLNEKYQKRVRQYWTTKVKARDRESIRKNLAVDYNLTGQNGELILLNEFQAYLLQENPGAPGGLGEYAVKNAFRLRKFMSDLLPN